MSKWVSFLLVIVTTLALTVGARGEELSAPKGGFAPVIRSFLPVKPLSRAHRPAELAAIVENPGESPITISLRLVLPQGVRLIGAAAAQTTQIEAEDSKEMRWTIEAQEPGTYPIGLEVLLGNDVKSRVETPVTVLAQQDIQKLPYIPEPAPVKTDILVGAHNCPLWEADRPNMWSQLLKHPERTPALGFYAQENPEVADWETKWATEHGVDYFIYCWYRASQGGPVKMNFGSAIHDALFKSRFVSKMKFTIMWENQSKGLAGVSNEDDLMRNLLPFWIETYFKHPSYLKLNNKPLLFIYRPENLIDDLGGEEKVVIAFNKMREACRQAGFDGLYILGEYRGLDPEHLKLMKRIGLDYTFAYCWHVPDSPTPAQAIAAQVDSITKTQAMNILPQVVTISQAWSGWNDEGSIWKLPPNDFKTLLQKAKDIIQTFPATELGRNLLILDNWNEWGEGHYIAPYREYGFGYLDAVRDVFAKDAGPHNDVLPEDVGMGPYDTPYQDYLKREAQLRWQVSAKVTKPGAPETGLIGWWAFDEPVDAPVAMDYSGNRLGGALRNAKRAPGIDGNALRCDGGCVEVVNNPRLSPPTSITIECWINPDREGQENTWFLNRVFGGGTSTGYRMGMMNGRPCFEVPLTDWSHHLVAKVAAPKGQWTHVAGTFDGATERIYVNGEEQGAMERPGPIHANTFHLCLGNFEIGHASHFDGALDEVKLYDRALPAETIRQHYRQLVSKAESRK